MVQLLKGMHEFQIDLDSLRFFVAIEDVDFLCKIIQLAPFVKKLNDFKQIALKINALDPTLQFAKRRKNALLGQDIFSKSVVIQCDPLMMVVDKQDFYKMKIEEFPAIVSDLIQKSKVEINPYQNVFENLEDEEHDIGQ